MKKIQTLASNCYYMIESLAGARNCYFESKEEIEIFKKMFDQYLSKYIETHKMYLSPEGYQVLVRLKTKRTIVSHYKKSRGQKNKEIKLQMISEPWRIISEQIRVFLSVYVKRVNKMRNREGVLVKSNYSKYYFTDEAELQTYIKRMDAAEELRSQRIKKYRLRKKWKKALNWTTEWARKSAESKSNNSFQDFVLRNLVKRTFSTHSPSISSQFHLKSS